MMSQLNDNDLKLLCEYFKSVSEPVDTKYQGLLDKLFLIEEQIDLAMEFQGKFQVIRSKIDEIEMKNIKEKEDK